MNTRLVDRRTMWAVVAMEAAFYVPLISLPAQGDRIMGLSGAVLLLVLLPLGYVGIYQIRELRDPSWRLLAGIGLALLTRLVVSAVPEPGLSGLFMWLGHSFVPAAIGVALWWRGGALAVAELTPAEVRTEFGALAVCLVALLALVRPFLLGDPLLLAGSVGVFAVAGLIGTALSRQDAAEVGSDRLFSSASLAVAAGLVPAGLAVLLVAALQPQLMGTLWMLLARAIELALTPIGWLLNWLGSFFPRGAPPAPPPRPPLPAPPTVDPAALAEAQERLAWIGTVIVLTLLVAAALATLLVARLLLTNFIRDPSRGSERRDSADVVLERSGAPTDEAADALGWLMRWLRARLSRTGHRRSGSRARGPGAEGAVDAWAAYQRLLGWAEAHGMARRPAETTGQLSARVAQRVPEAADAVDLVTETYEWERYGAVAPAADRLRRVQAALTSLLER